jgi:purine nucleoside phosphorylase
MSVGIITGSGVYGLPGFEDAERVSALTPFGVATLTRGHY